jgi:hypothetical protein
MSDVCPVETMDEEGFDAAAATAPYETKALLESVVRGAVAEGVDDMEGAREAEGAIEERALEGVAILDGAVGAK